MKHLLEQTGYQVARHQAISSTEHVTAEQSREEKMTIIEWKVFTTYINYKSHKKSH